MNGSITKWMFVLLLAIGALVAFLWDDMGQQLGDSATRLATPGSAAISDEAVAAARGAFVRDALQPAGVSIADIRTQRPVGAGDPATITFRLTAATAADYPALMLTLLSRDGKVRRTLFLLPGMYSHGSALRDEYVRIAFVPHADESQFELHAVDAAALHVSSLRP